MLLSVLFVHSLSQDKVRSSPSEGAAIVRSFVECLRYCITKLLELDNQPVVEYLMLEQVRTEDF